MPLPGPIVVLQIQQARRSAQAALADARTAAAATRRELESLSAEGNLAPLADQVLTAPGREALTHAWGETATALQQILLHQQQHVFRLASEMDRYEREREVAEQELATLMGRLDEQLNHQQTLSDTLVQRLAEDDRFETWTQQAAQTEAALERSEAGLAEIEHDAMQKLPAYENSRLFKYLHDRRMATSRYTASGFQRRIDDWIGGLIDYTNAKAGYDYLQNTPEQVRALVAADRDALAPIMHRLERRRDEEAANLGLPQSVAEVQSAEQVRGTLLGQLEQLRRKEDAIRRELAEIEEIGGPYYRHAIELFQSLLEKTEKQLPSAPIPHDAATPDGGPSARLRSLAERLDGLRLQAAGRAQRIDALRRHLSELGYFHQRFCAAGFDSSRSYFDDSLNLVDEFERVRDGSESIDVVWQRMRRSQRFGPPSRGLSADRSPLGRGPSAEDLLAGGAFLRPGGLTAIDGAPLSRTLVSAMVRAAGEPMRGYARRAAIRWTGSHGGGWRNPR